MLNQKYFATSQVVISILWVILALVTKVPTNFLIVLTLMAIVNVLILTLGGFGMNILSFIKPRLSLVGLFIIYIFANFTPYIFQLQDDTSAVLVAVVPAILGLVGFILTKFQIDN